MGGAAVATVEGQGGDGDGTAGPGGVRRARRAPALGRAVQVDPIRPKLKALGCNRLNQEHERTL